MLYEFVFAHSDFESGFHLYFQVPQTLVSCSSNSILEEEGICTSTMLAVEKCDQNVLTILGDVEVKVVLKFEFCCIQSVIKLL